MEGNFEKGIKLPNDVFYIWEFIYDDKVYKVVDYILSVQDRRINPNVSLVDILNLGYFNIDTLTIRKKISERILKDNRVNISNVLKAIKKFSQRISANMEELSMLNFYLDFVKNKNGVEQLREIIGDGTPNILRHVYKYLA